MRWGRQRREHTLRHAPRVSMAHGPQRVPARIPRHRRGTRSVAPGGARVRRARAYARMASYRYAAPWRLCDVWCVHPLRSTQSYVYDERVDGSRWRLGYQPLT